VFAGLLVMTITIPINAWATKKEGEKQKELMEIKDSRIKCMDEMLSGMKVVKLYAWEEPLARRVADLREGEVGILRYLAYLFGLTNFTFSLNPYMVTMTVLGLYAAIYPEDPLTADKIFVTLSLFSMLKMPMVALPWAIVVLVR